MWQRTRRSLSHISPKTRLAAFILLAAVSVGAGAAWAIARSPGSATSQGRDPNAADFSQRPLTPLAVPSALPTPIPESERGCRGPADEVPGPGLPPLPCHTKGNEPPPGAIPPAGAEERSDALANTQKVPEGWQIYDNPMFRYTFAVPPDWYVNMRPEGGEFAVFDPNEMAWFAGDKGVPAGVVMALVAETYDSAKSDDYVAHAATPNASFGEYRGTIWEQDLHEEGVAKVMFFAFRRDAVLFRGRIHFGEGYQDSQVTTVRQILSTITPY